MMDDIDRLLNLHYVGIDVSGWPVRAREAGKSRVIRGTIDKIWRSHDGVWIGNKHCECLDVYISEYTPGGHQLTVTKIKYCGKLTTRRHYSLSLIEFEILGDEIEMSIP